MTNDDLEKLLGKSPDAEFRPYFSTRVIAKLGRYNAIPVLGTLFSHRLLFRRYIYITAVCLLVLLGFSVYQEGSLSFNHLIGLGGFSEDEILNYINPLI